MRKPLRLMDLPNHLRADIRQGMNPAVVLAVHCSRCGEYMGQIRSFEGQDTDTVICETCEKEDKQSE